MFEKKEYIQNEVHSLISPLKKRAAMKLLDGFLFSVFVALLSSIYQPYESLSIRLIAPTILQLPLICMVWYATLDGL